MRRIISTCALLAAMSPALAQTCIDGPAGMRMCDNGFMAMGGMWMQLPPPVAVATAPPGGHMRWSMREALAPDGSRRQIWSSEATLPDGSVVREEKLRVIAPDGRVCDQAGAGMRCD